MEVLKQKSDLLHEHQIEENNSTKDEKLKDEFVTVVSVGNEKDIYENVNFNNQLDSQKNGFVTVLTIGDEISQPKEIIEEVLVYRLPGERLGFGLKFEGGTKTTECVRRLFIQSCAPDSPASRVKCSWGNLSEGDEVLKIDSNSVRNMTRIDCVRCLKDSNVVIKLLIKHCSILHDDYITDNITAFHSDDEIPSEQNLDNKTDPPPPPIPPRKLSRKMMKEKSLSSNDIINIDTQITPKIRQNGDVSCNEFQKVAYPKSAPRNRPPLDLPPKVPVRDRKLSDVSSGPPDAEVYLDLLSQESEYSVKTESESDDTGSTISTVIDRHNSIFLASNPSSIASDSIPSTPTAVQKQMDLSKVVNPFEILEMEYAANIKPNDDFLFTRFVTSHEILKDLEENANIDHRISDCEKVSLVPPANFQDAPLSYGNEEVTSISTHNSNNDDDIEHKIIEEIRVPKPVPRKCYSKKKLEQEDIKISSDDIEDTDSLDTVDFNLPRLVNFVPKNPQKIDLEVPNKKEDNFNNDLCVIKYDDFNYMYSDNSEMIECNNNDCEKIISCSTWSLNNHLETIGEIEEEMDSLENLQDGYKPDDEQKPTPKANKETNDISHKIYDSYDNCIQSNSKIDNEKSDKNETENSTISSNENYNMICENDEASQANIENEIPIIQLTHDDGDNSIPENKDEINTKIKSKPTEINEAMEVTNFIQSEQQHAITTSEYSSLSSLSSPPLSFSSRLPPDGQEFPPVCQETRSLIDKPNNEIMAGQPLSKSEPTALPKMSTEKSFTPSWVKNQTENTANTRNNLLWKKERNSIGSIKDKIAIFSAADTNEQPLLPMNKLHKSSENILEDKSNLYDKKNQISKSCLFMNNIPNNDSENQNNFNKYTSISSSNDLKSKESNNFDNKPNLNHTTSFNSKPSVKLHARSQSMLDMSSLDSPWNNPNSDSRKLTLNTLIEQRRRGFSKLRGLVIPQKEVPIAEPVLDLPEIRIKDQNLPAKSLLPPIRSQSETAEAPIVANHQRSNSTNLQSSSWKSNSITNLPNLPRYSPAFKRKCLQVYVMEQSSSGSNYSNSPKTSDSVFQSDYETNNTSLNSVGGDEVFRKNSIGSDENYNTSNETQKMELPITKSVDNITSPSNSEISFEYSFQSTNSTNSLETHAETRPTDIRQIHNSKKIYTTKNKIDLQRPEDDSDNDSAVSSSQSSYISRECSPLPSPLQDYINNSSNTTIDGITNGVKSKELYLTANGVNGRVLKPQSVEAINRKNILASAKCRSGKDFKNGSPLIQRKLSASEDEKPDIVTNNEEKEENIDLSNTEEASLSDNVSTESVKDISTDETDIKLSPKPELKIPVPSEPVVPKILKEEIISEPIIPEITVPKLNTTPNVLLRNNIVPTLRKTADKPDRPTSMLLPTSSRYDAKKRASVNDIRKQFEKFEVENQKSPTLPQPKPKITPRSIPVKTAISPVEKLPNAYLPNKEAKIVTKVDKKPTALPRSITIPKEELDQLLNEVNEGLDKTSNGYINPNEVIIIQLFREFEGGSIGITLTGGTDYEAKEITVHKVLTGSCAHKDGRLKKGDRILSINGKSMIGLTHKDSVEILKDPKPDKVTLVVSPCKGKTTPVAINTSKIRKTSSEVSIPDEVPVSPTIIQPTSESVSIKVELLKDGTGLGFSLDGGKDSPKGDMPLIIKKIFTGGAAEKCGLLLAGDELIEVNATEVLKMTRIEVWSMMKKLPDGKVSLTIRR